MLLHLHSRHKGHAPLRVLTQVALTERGDHFLRACKQMQQDYARLTEETRSPRLIVSCSSR